MAPAPPSPHCSALFTFQDIFKQATEDRLTSAKELPYFEGDFWPNVLEESIKELEQEEEERKKEESTAASETTEVKPHHHPVTSPRWRAWGPGCVHSRLRPGRLGSERVLLGSQDMAFFVSGSIFIHNLILSLSTAGQDWDLGAQSTLGAEGSEMWALETPYLVEGGQEVFALASLGRAETQKAERGGHPATEPKTDGDGCVEVRNQSADLKLL